MRRSLPSALTSLFCLVSICASPAAQGWFSVPTGSAPSKRYAHSSVYDAGLARVLMFGGADEVNNLRADTWTWDGAT